MYVGTKLIKAIPMTRLEYNVYRNWDLPADEEGGDKGFMVEYMDGGQANHPNHTGYISWSPAEVFKNTYHTNYEFTFSDALVLLKQGCKMARTGWNGKGMFIFLVDGSTFRVNRKPLLGIYKEGTEINYHAHIDMRAADGTIVPWLCSQTDMLANDWCFA